MDERRAVSRSPGELGSKSNNNWVLNQILGRNVADFLLLSSVLLGVGVELNHFLSAQLGNITDIVEGLNLVEVHQVVDHPQVVVVVHGNVEALHGFSASSKLADCTINTVLSLHELIVLGSDLFDDLRSMNIAGIRVPVDGCKAGGTLAVTIVVVQDGLKLSVLLS